MAYSSRLIARLMTGVWFTLITFTFSALADPPVKDENYRALIADFREEVREFDQFTDHGKALSPSVQKYIVRWEKWFEAGGKGPAPVLTFKGKRWRFDLKERRAGVGAPSPVADLSKMNLGLKIRGLKSAMEDPELYVRSRIGTSTFDLFRDGKAKPVIFGGSVESWQKNAMEPGSIAYHVPSPYEEWGISKFLVNNKNGSAEVAFVVPPIREYVLHHLALVEYAGATESTGWLNEAERFAMRARFSEAMSSLPLDVREKIRKSWVTMGYAGVLREHPSVVERIVAIESPLVDLEIFRLRDETQIVALSSKLTLWGEGSAFLVESILPHRPLGVAFMGSAGYLLGDKTVYHFHAPKSFLDAGANLVSIESANPEAVGKHLAVFSPLVETIERVDEWIAKGIVSVDVEQSLVAKSIFQYNQANGTNIRFSAWNLLTDLPASSYRDAHESFNLDNVNPELKKSAKREIVKDAVGFLVENHRVSCQTYLLPPT